MRWSRLLRALVDTSASEQERDDIASDEERDDIRTDIRKEVRINRALAVNDEPGATTSASAVQDRPAIRTTPP